MQNQPMEIEDVVRGLLKKPTLERQAAVQQKYFTEDVVFTHFHDNTTDGLKDPIAIYQMAELNANYPSVEFQKVGYNERADTITLRMSVFIRPLGILPGVALKYLTLLELEDYKIEGGKTVKKINVQRDYFQRSPPLVMIPFFGRIYESDMISTVIGSLMAATFDVLKQGFNVLSPFLQWKIMLK